MADTPRLTLPQDGRLASVGLPLLLGRLGVLRATGVLDLSRKKLLRRVVLDGGTIVALASNAREDRFLEWLVRERRLPGLDEAGLAAVRRNVGDQPLTGGALVALGFLAATEAASLLGEHAAALLRETAEWPDTTFSIQPGRVPLEREPAAALPALALALALARPADSARRNVPLPWRVAAPVLPGDPERGLLSEIEQTVLQACAKRAEPHLLAGTLDRDAAAVQQALEALWRAGLLVEDAGEAVDEDEGDVSAESLDRWLVAAQAEDLEGLLGVASAADEATVRKAYYRTVRRFHPDRFRAGPFAARHREVEQAFRLVHEAVRVLSSPAARAEFEARRLGAMHGGPARTQSAIAGEAYLRGIDALAAGKRGEALTWLERAAAALPEEPLYEIQLGLLLAINPTRRGDGIQKLGRLTKAEAANADVLAAYALVLHHAGKAAEAQAALGKLRQLDPRNAVALALSGNADAVRLVRQDPFLALYF